MKTRLLVVGLLYSLFSFAQSAVVKSPQLENEFQVKLEKTSDGKIDVYINDSKNPNTSQRLSVSETITPTLLHLKILKTINDGSKGFYYCIPNTDPKLSLNVAVEKEKITESDLVAALKKMNKDALSPLVKSKVFFNIKDNKLNFKKYIEQLKNLNQVAAVFPDATEAKGYTLKRTAVESTATKPKIELFVDGVSIGEIKPDDEAAFYEKLYEKIKADDATLKELFAADLMEAVKSVEINTDENAANLEQVLGELKGKEKIINYSYLGYVGTNFDLVDGVRAKNLFFAANIMVTPKAKERIGFYISLYGNRTVSRIDSIPNIGRDVRVNDSIGNQYIHRERSTVVKKLQSDNLGAFFSPLIRLDCYKKRENLKAVRTSPASFYFAPSLEFIWRRTAVDLKYVDTKKLPAEQLPNLQPTYTNTLSYRQNNTYSIYDFYIAPIGFWLLHENETISIRLNMNVGYSTRYAPTNYLNTNNDINFETIVQQDSYSNTNDVFYTGKLWITERTTGITLQGEINNTLERPNPYYGVTLSKAFDFDKLGQFFAPISNRSSTPVK